MPRENPGLIGTLKLPVGRDGFFNEIHPKLRPVETVVDGVMIAGSCQAPKTVAESVASGLAAVTQAAAVLKRGVAELDPQVADGEPLRLHRLRGLRRRLSRSRRSPWWRPGARGGAGTAAAAARVAAVDAAGCKGCGACAPVCPEDAHRPARLHRRPGAGDDRRLLAGVPG